MSLPAHDNAPVDLSDEDQDAAVQHAVQDPQVLRVKSLSLQRNLQNRFDRERNGSRTSKKKESEEMANRIKNMSEILQTKVMTDPETFTGPLNSFLSQFEKMKTDSTLISSLCTFGKYNGAVSCSAQRIRNKYLLTSKKIGVQPTAVARRKAALGGRRALITGRPVKGANIPEHSYAKSRRRELKRGELPKRQKRAPHSLSQCVSDNVTIGRTHSVK
nr:uncharacterized protein LOC129263679 [Lytechinus pictus]